MLREIPEFQELVSVAKRIAASKLKRIVSQAGVPVSQEDVTLASGKSIHLTTYAQLLSAEIGGKSVASLVFKKSPVNPSTLILDDVSVSSDMQGQGVGTVLIQRAIEQAKQGGYTRIDTLAADTSSGILLKCGFKPLQVHEREGKYTGPMRLELQTVQPLTSPVTRV